jgi:hypothetical protein
MNKNKISLSLALVSTITICGCASNNTKDSCEQFSKDNMFFNSQVFDRNEDVSSVKVETAKKTEFYEAKPSKIFSGITSVDLSGSSLNVTFFHQGLFEQYTAPVLDVMIERRSKSNSFGYAPLPAPLLAWVFTPEKMQNFTKGCTERRFLRTEPDETKKVKTGKSEWMDVSRRSHKILISGFDKDYEFSVNADTSTKVIDLSSAILNTPLSKNTTLKVTCLDCDLLGTEEKNLYPNVKTDVALTHDFRATKLALSESQKIQESETKKAKFEQEKRNQEIAKKAQIQKTSSVLSPVISINSDESSISHLEEIKEKCKDLGFKPQSEKFGKCVLELTK